MARFFVPNILYKFKNHIHAQILAKSGFVQNAQEGELTLKVLTRFEILLGVLRGDIVTVFKYSYVN